MDGKLYCGFFSLANKNISIYEFGYTIEHGEIRCEAPLFISWGYSTEYVQNEMDKVLNNFDDEDTVMMISKNKQKVEDWLNEVKKKYLDKYESILEFLQKPIQYKEYQRD